MNTLVVLGASALQIPLIRAARATGYPVVTLDNVPTNVGHRFATRSYNVSTRDLDGVLEVATRESAVGVLTAASDNALLACATVCEALGLFGPPVRVVETWCVKPSFRAHQRPAGLRHPGFIAGDDPVRLTREAQSLSGELIVKPSDRSGSRGVHRLASARDAGLGRAIEDARELAFDGRVCIEECIVGPEYGGDAWVSGGRVTALFPTRKIMDGFIVRGHRIPAGLCPEAEASMRSQLQDHVRAVNYEQGPINFDIRIDADGTPWIIELAPRLGGNWIPELIARARGIDLFGALVAATLGTHPDLTPSCKRSAAVYVIGLDQALTLESPIDTDTIRERIPSLVALEIDLSAGDSAEPMQDSGQQIGRALIDLSLSRASLESTIEALEAELADQLGVAALRPVTVSPASPSLCSSPTRT